MIEEGGQVEDGDREGRKEKERHDLPGFGVLSRRGDPPENEPHPEKEAHCKQELPRAPQVEVFPPLMSDPEPEGTEHLPDPEHLSYEAAQRDEYEGGKEKVDAQRLSSRLLASQGARQEEPSRDIGGRDPEDGKLKVPRAEHVRREEKR